MDPPSAGELLSVAVSTMLPQLVSQKTTGCSSDWPWALRIKMLRSGTHMVPDWGLESSLPSLSSSVEGCLHVSSFPWGDLWDGSNPYFIKNLRAVGLVNRSGVQVQDWFQIFYLGPTSTTEVPLLVAPSTCSFMKWVNSVLFPLYSPAHVHMAPHILIPSSTLTYSTYTDNMNHSQGCCEKRTRYWSWNHLENCSVL